MSRVAQQIRSTSLNRALTVLGDWWTVLLIRDAFTGARQFDTFQSQLGIARQTLTNRLRELVKNDLLYTKPYQARPVRYEYRLTMKGLDLYPYALLLWRWQRKWGRNGDSALPARLIHKTCGQAMEPLFGCAHCHEEVTIRDVEWREGPGIDAMPAPVVAHGKRHTASRGVLDGERLYEHGAFIISDRWSHLILASAFLGCTTFDAFEGELGLAPNTLAQRLRLLVDARLLKKLPDAQDSRRFHYRLTDRSRDLFPISMMLVRWADHWMPDPGGPPMLRFHRACGQRLEPIVMCSACRQKLEPWDVRFERAAPAAHDHGMSP